MFSKNNFKSILFLVIFTGVLYPVFNQAADAKMRFRGVVGIDTYGYETSEDTHYLWLLNSVRFSAACSERPVSFHFSAGYHTNTAEPSSDTDYARLLSGYFQYGKLSSKYKAKAGRFFIHRGVALGVMDGVEFGTTINEQFGLTVFGGAMGPYSRKFEMENFSDAITYGGELSYKMGEYYFLKKSLFKLSQVYQKRDGDEIRSMIGLSTYHKLEYNLTWMNTIQMRVSGFRRLNTRIRYLDKQWNAMAEFAVLSPDVPEYSWFSSFEAEKYSRIRFSANRYLKGNDWGIGAEGGMMLAEGGTGFLGGPVFIIPFGQIGYRISSGDIALVSGPWVSLRYKVIQGLDVYGYGSMMNYQWDQFDIASDDITSVNAGANYTPQLFKSFDLKLEYQVYSTPQFKQDKRVLGGVAWKFDTGRN